MSDVLVLYQISNEFSSGSRRTKDAPHFGYNAFYLPRNKPNGGVTLSSIKQHVSRRSIFHHDQYHWRVRIDERPNTSHSSSAASSEDAAAAAGGNQSARYSWWDVQDENARLPIKEATPKELKRMFGPPKKKDESGAGGDVVTQEVAKVAKGAMKYMNKAMNMAVAGTHTSHHRDHGGYEDDNDGMDDDFGQRTAVICFKVLDLNKVRRDCAGSGGGGRVKRPAAATVAAPRRGTSTATTSTSSVSQHSSSAGLQRPHSKAPVSAGAPRIPPHNQPAARPSAPTGNLMDFGSPHLSHANSMPSVSSTTVATSATGKIHPDETRAEKLQREYAEKNANSNRVWDEVDERWVDGPVKNGEVISTTAASSNSFAATEVTTVTTSIQGISLCTSNAIGKSAQVQAAVHARVSEMQSSQQKAISELRSREAAKASADAEEEIVRQRLEPRLKAWSEEHGKKKQLRALLANLHTILWEGSGWKQVSLADVLDEAKVKRVYHKASRVVHPDKTGHLDAEKRFVSKRVFDALTQAKVEFDEGK